jgi:hypothetical protein
MIGQTISHYPILEELVTERSVFKIILPDADV